MNHANGISLRRWLVGCLVACVWLSADAKPYNKNTQAYFADVTNKSARADFRAGASGTVEFTGVPTGATVGGKLPFPWPGKSQAEHMANWKALAQKADLADTVARGRGLLGPIGAAALAGGAIALVLEAACVRGLGGVWQEGGIWEQCIFQQQQQTVYYVAATGGSYPVGPFPSKSQACTAFAQRVSTDTGNSYVVDTYDPECWIERTDTGSQLRGFYSEVTGPVETQIGWGPATEEQVRQKVLDELDASSPTLVRDLFRDLHERGATVEVGSPTVTGPASSPPSTQSETKTQTKTMPDGSTTTVTITSNTTTTTNYTYEGDTVTNIINITTTTTTTDEDGTTTEETTEEKEDDGDPCEKNPDSLACQELEVPEGEVPKSTSAIAYVVESLGLGGGSCPAARSISFAHGTVSMPMQAACDTATGIFRPVILALGALAAMMICAAALRGD